MTTDEAKGMVEKVQDAAWDDEQAHWLEDSLYIEFIEFVAKRDDELGEIARIVLQTRDIRFSRWYA